MNAISILEAQHKKAGLAMEAISQATGSHKKELFKALKSELEAHDSLEENIFYPAIQQNIKTADFYSEDSRAHQVVEKALKVLLDMPIEDASWGTSFESMRAILLKHVADEEQNVFPKISKTLTIGELDALGARMEQGTEKPMVKS